MILRRIELKSFGRFSEAAFDFRRGLNLVLGPSESGKSTLAESIPLVLFGARDKERFRPWSGGAECTAALVFESAGRSLRIERNLTADRVELVESDAEARTLTRFSGRVPLQEETAESAAYRLELLRFFGLAEEEIFRSGLLLEQGFAERFRSAGAFAQIVPLLERAERVPETSTFDGADGIEAVRQRLAELEQLWFATRRALDEIGELPARIIVLEASIQADREDFSRGERYLAPLRGLRLESASPSSGSVELDLEAKRSELARELARTGLPREMPADLPALLVQADEIRQEMIGIQKEAADLRQQLLKRPTPSWRPAAVVTLISAFLAGFLAWSHSPWLTAGLALGGVAAGVSWSRYLWRAVSERAERGRLKVPLQQLEERRDEAQARLSGLDERFSRLGLSPSAVEIVRMQKNLERHLRLQQELKEVENALGLRGGETEGVAPSATDVRVPDEPPIRSREDLAEAEARLAEIGDDLRRREGELQELNRRSAEQQELQERLRLIEEEGEALRRRESELLKRPKTGPSAHTGQRPPADLIQLENEVGQFLAGMTDGRYTSVRLEKDGPCSLAGEDGAWRSLGHFSRGTMETFAFVLRLAVARHLSRGVCLPLVLDDSLAGLGQTQVSEGIKLLERLAGEQQLILFSRDETLRKRMARERWHIVSLTAQTARKPSRSQERSEDDGQLHLL